MLAQLRTQGLYPTLNAPQFQDNGTSAVLASQRVNVGYLLKMALVSPAPGGTTSAGAIYYTTDGSDPRVYYDTTGLRTPTALAYTTPIAINASATVKARALNGTVWSALNTATFTVAFAPSPVRITEIMYNPPNASGGTSSEFIELLNTRALDADLSGCYFSGVDFVFPNGFILGPGDRLVLANNNAPATFAAQYPGVVVSGYFGGALSNGGQRLALIDPTGRTLDSVEYDDENYWNTLPDGGGYSLEIIDPLGDPDSPLNWKASNALKGTPGQPNSTSPAPTLVINEVLADNAGVVLVNGMVTGYIELKNIGGSAINLQNYILSWGSQGIFLNSQVIQPGGFYVLPVDLKGIGRETPGNVRLATQNGVLVDAIEYGRQAPNFAIGRIGGVWTLTSPTVGADNVAATAALAAGNLVLNEWLSDALPGSIDWIEIYNKHTTLPVALQGLYFQTDTQLYRYPTLSFIGPQSYLQLFANEQPGTSQLDFKLPATGTTLAILDAAGTPIDTLSAAQFGTPPQGVSRGRVPDGAATFSAFTGSSSPGAANYLNTYTGPMVNEVLARNLTGAQTPWGTRAGWIELFNSGVSAFDLSGMKLTKTNSLTGVFPYPLPIWTFPAGTSLAAGGYLAVWCDAAQPASASFSTDLNTGFTLGDASGGLYLFNAAGQLVSTVEYGFQLADRSFGLSAGTLKLLAAPTRAAANSAAQTLGAASQLRINEWMALQTAPAATDWFELFNLDANPVAMAGLYLTDDPSELGRTQFAIPALSFIDGRGWVKWEADSAPELGRNHVNFSLASDAEYIRLSNNDASFTAIDTISYGLQTTDVSQGRIPDGASNIVSFPGSPTPGAKNVLLPAPSFTLQPISQTVAQGANVTLTVAATGSAPLTYQWRFNNTDLGGATGASLILNGVTIAQDGTYACIATNTAGSVPSNSASLIVQSTYAQWAAYYGLTGPAAATTADPDGDGLTNLQEFTHHLSPLFTATTADRAVLPIPGFDPPTGSPQYFTLTYRRSARAIYTSLDHQLSPTLANGSWNNTAPDVTEPLSPDPATGDPRYRVKFTIAPGETAKFLRLLLTP